MHSIYSWLIPWAVALFICICTWLLIVSPIVTEIREVARQVRDVAAKISDLETKLDSLQDAVDSFPDEAGSSSMPRENS